jgi:hypothetical protein
MSKRRRANPSNKFVMLERWFCRCPAWRVLPHAARSLYIELELLYCGTNNGEIRLGVRKAMELLGCSFNHVRKMFAELEAKGFVRVAQRGAFNWKSGHATTWILTKHDYQGKPATSDFMRWQPPEKQKTDAHRASDGRTQSVRDQPWNRPTDAHRASVKADSASPRTHQVIQV